MNQHLRAIYKAGVFRPLEAVSLPEHDDAKKGGDIDLLFETDHPVSNRATTIGVIYAALIRQLGDRKIDILLKDSATPPAPVLDSARQTGILL